MIELLRTSERINNPSFNSLEFEGIKNHAGLNRLSLLGKRWVKKTNTIAIKSKAVRYGGTYAHSDIVFEFGVRFSPETR